MAERLYDELRDKGLDVLYDDRSSSPGEKFADAELPTLSEAELDEFEIIMDEQDIDLSRWVLGTFPVPERFQTPLFARIISYTPDFEEMTAEMRRTAE